MEGPVTNLGILPKYKLLSEFFGDQILTEFDPTEFENQAAARPTDTAHRYFVGFRHGRMTILREMTVKRSTLIADYSWVWDLKQFPGHVQRLLRTI